MRRPRRRLVYTMGLRDPDIPSYVPPDSFVKCEDDFQTRGGGPSPSEKESCSTSVGCYSSASLKPMEDLQRETSFLQQVRSEVQQLELEANYARIMGDLCTTRTVLEEMVDEVVAGFADGRFSKKGAAESSMKLMVDEVSFSGRGHLPPADGSQGSSYYSLKEITSERKFSSLHLKHGTICREQPSRAGEAMSVTLEKVKKIRDLLVGPSSSAVADDAVCFASGPAAVGSSEQESRERIPSEKFVEHGAQAVAVGERVAGETMEMRPMKENVAFEPGATLRSVTEPLGPEELQLPDEGPSAGFSGGVGAGLRLCDLEQSLWSTLPYDLMERILACLPLPSLVSCRAVCRKWNRTLMEDRGFLAVYSAIPPEKPWLFTWDSWIEDDSHAYNPRLDRWYKIPLGFIPHEHVKRPLHIVGAVGGLLFFEYFARLYIALCLCNPVTRAWRKFPPLNEKRVQPVVAVFQDCESSAQRGDFIVVVAGGLSKPSVMHKVYSTEIFHSRANCWRKTCDKITDDGGHIRWGPYVRTAFCNGSLYYMLWRFKLLAYNMSSGTWSHVQAPCPPALDPESGISPFLVESRGRLLMIGFVDNDRRVVEDGLAIWELKSGGSAWVEIARMPDKFFERMPLRKIQGVGCSDLIYIYENFSTPVVICDLSKQTPEWRQIDSGCIRGNSRVIYGCATDLRLDAALF